VNRFILNCDPAGGERWGFVRTVFGAAGGLHGRQSEAQSVLGAAAEKLLRPFLKEKTMIGERVTRLEDPPLVRGQGRFAADISFVNQLHMRVVRSPIANGRIKKINVEEASRGPGVFAIWTAADIDDLPPVPFREGPIERLNAYRQPVLALDRVRYVGDPVAAVFAEDPYAAEDAAELVEIIVEEEAPLLRADEEPREFSSGHSTEADIIRRGYGAATEAFDKASLVIELELAIGRHTGVPLETRGAIAHYDKSRDVLELYGAAKIPHKNREIIAGIFGRSLGSVHLFEGNVGGGFGVRGELYPEDFLVCAGALRLGRPIKWIEDRREHLIAANHSRQQRHRVRAAVDEQGRVLAIDDEFYLDQGAYLRTHAVRVATFTAAEIPGPYDIAAYRCCGRVRLTNKTPAATYRAPGCYESTFVCERLMDAIAARTGLSRIEVRLRNLIRREQLPYDRVFEGPGENTHLDSGDYPELLQNALRSIGWKALEASIAARRARGENVGVGFGIFVEPTGMGPRDGVEVRVDSNGFVEVITGGSSIGQGFETVIAQICASALGCDFRAIRVVRGRTDRIEHGIGAHASRATVMTGNATHVAAQEVKKKTLRVASAMLQTDPDRLVIQAGVVSRSDLPHGPSISLAEIAASLSPASKSLPDQEPGLSARGWFVSDRQVYSYGVHIAVVSVDIETGRTKVETYLAALDIGRAINPMLVEGQVQGGVVQGIGGALFEEFIYSDTGEPLAVTFADYLIPTASEIPAMQVLIREYSRTDRNPLGIKGAGENGITGVGAAIASAIDDAIGIPGAVKELPVTPARLRAIIKQARTQRP
jgi:aerobic carbon-monoxide dehydrogenase large subunit